DKWLNQYTISSPHATRGAVPRRLFAAKPAHGWPSLRSRRAPHRSPAISRQRRAWLGVGPVGRADLSPRWVTIGAIGSRLGTESPRWVAIPPIGSRLGTESPRWVAIPPIGSRLGTESPRWVAIPPIGSRFGTQSPRWVT